MNEWNKENEKLLRDVGEHFERQTKDFLNPKVPAVITALRTAFRDAVSGNRLRRRMRESSLRSGTASVFGSMQAMIKLAEDNASDAAEKIKKTLLVLEQIDLKAKATPTGAQARRGSIGYIKFMKKSGIPYP